MILITITQILCHIVFALTHNYLHHAEGVHVLVFDKLHLIKICTNSLVPLGQCHLVKEKIMLGDAEGI